MTYLYEKYFCRNVSEHQNAYDICLYFDINNILLNNKLILDSDIPLNYIDSFNNLLNIMRLSQIIFLTNEEYDKGNYKSINKDKQTCIEVKTGKVIQVEKTDPRWKTGEIIGNQKGKKWLKKDGKCTLVHSEKINSYINDGWEFGFINNKGKHKND